MAAAVIACGASYMNSSATPLLVALVPVILTWQLQEFVRRVLYTEARFAAAFINDMVSYGMQMVLVTLLLWKDGLLGGAGGQTADAMGDAPKIMYCLAITSGAAPGPTGTMRVTGRSGYSARAGAVPAALAARKSADIRPIILEQFMFAPPLARL